MDLIGLVGSESEELLLRFALPLRPLLAFPFPSCWSEVSEGGGEVMGIVSSSAIFSDLRLEFPFGCGSRWRERGYYCWWRVVSSLEKVVHLESGKHGPRGSMLSVKEGIMGGRETNVNRCYCRGRDEMSIGRSTCE